MKRISNIIILVLSIIIVALLVLLVNKNNQHKNYKIKVDTYQEKADNTFKYLFSCLDNPLQSQCNYDGGLKVGTEYKQAKDSLK